MISAERRPPSIKVCNRCRKVRYCDAAFQAEHWNQQKNWTRGATAVPRTDQRHVVGGPPGSSRAVHVNSKFTSQFTRATFSTTPHHLRPPPHPRLWPDLSASAR